jgi:hypothetical protein
MHKDAKVLIDAVRKNGFEVEITPGGHAKVYRRGNTVMDAEGVPLTIATTPSDNSYRKNTVRRLVRAKVLEVSPWSNWQPAKPKKAPPVLVEGTTAAQGEALLEKVRSWVEETPNPTDTAYGILTEWAKMGEVELPSRDAVAQQISQIHNLTTMRKTAQQRWRLILKGAPDLPVEAPPLVPPAPPAEARQEGAVYERALRLFIRSEIEDVDGALAILEALRGR